MNSDNSIDKKNGSAGSIHAESAQPAFLESFNSSSVGGDFMRNAEIKENNNDSHSLAPSVITYYREEDIDGAKGNESKSEFSDSAASFDTRLMLDSLPQTPGPLNLPLTAANALPFPAPTSPPTEEQPEVPFRDRRNGSLVAGVTAAAPLLEYRQSMNEAKSGPSATNDPLFNAQLQSHRFIVANAEKFGDKPLKRTSFWRRHRCLLISIAIALVLLAIGGVLVFLYLPQIVQAVVNGSQMEISQLTISQPTRNGFTAHIVGRMSRGGPFDATTEPMLLTISSGEPIGQLDMPAIQLKGGQADIDVQTRFRITNHRQFSRFCQQLLNGEQFVWTIAGITNVQVFGRQFENVTLSKEVPLAAMNRFAGVSVREFNLTRIPSGGDAKNETKNETSNGAAPTTDEVGVEVVADLENRSPISLELGNLRLAMFYETSLIGLVESSNVTLSSGQNSFAMSGRMLPPVDLTASSNRTNETANNSAASNISAPLKSLLTAVRESPRPNYSQLFSNYLTGKPSDIRVIGLSVVPSDGGRPIRWLSEAIRQMNFTVRLQAPEPLKIIQNVTIDGMQMDFSQLSAALLSPSNTTTTTTASNSSSESAPTVTVPLPNPQFSAKNVSVHFKLPFDFPCIISSTVNSISVLNEAASGGEGSVMALIESTQTANASNAVDPNVITTYFPTADMQILQTDQFRDYLTALFVGGGGLNTRIRVRSTVQADTPLGPVTLSGIEFTQQLPLSGMQALKATIGPEIATNPVVLGVQVVNGTTEHIKMNVTLSLFSPASVGVRMGDVRLEMYTEGQWIGYAMLPDLTVNPGTNVIQSWTYFSPPPNDPVGRRMVSNYLNGQPNIIQMIGTSEKSTPIAVIAGSLSFLNLSAPMAGVREPLVLRSYLKVSPKTLVSSNGKARFELVNPFQAPFTILAMQATISDDGQAEIGWMNIQLNDTSALADPSVVPEEQRAFTVGANMRAKTPYYPLGLRVDWSTVNLAKGGVFSTFGVDTKCVIDCKVGEYRLIVDYNQSRLPTELDFI